MGQESETDTRDNENHRKGTAQQRDKKTDYFVVMLLKYHTSFFKKPFTSHLYKSEGFLTHNSFEIL